MSTVSLHYQEQGRPDGPAVLLAPSLGTTLDMWDELADALSGRYRVIRFDTRGHGGSPVPAGPYSVEELADDVLALADRLGIDRFAVVGLSLGGAVAQTLALRAPERLTALVLCCTGPSFGEPGDWRSRAARVRADGMGWLLEPTRQRWFTPEFPATHPRRAEALLEQIANTPPEGYAACCEALAGFDTTARLAEIRTPTRVISGADDPVSPPSTGEILHCGIAGADLVVLPDSSHIANVARVDEFNAAVAEFLEQYL